MSSSAPAAAGSVVVGVRDTGVGISPEYLPHVFDLSMQSSPSLDRTQGGLGIGLTVVKLLAELHGGSAHVSSAGPERGTEASIRLPATGAALPVASDAHPPVSPRSQPRRIVIIDDNVDSAEMLAQYLQIAGHVVICDIGRPGLDGYGVARRLRADPAFERCLLIAITGYGDAVDRERTRSAGFAHHLTKPADPVRVGRLIASHESAPA